MTVGEKVATLRRLRGMTQENLAEAMTAQTGKRVRQGYVAKLESGMIEEPRSGTVGVLAMVLDVPADELIGIERDATSIPMFDLQRELSRYLKRDQVEAVTTILHGMNPQFPLTAAMSVAGAGAATR